MRRRRPLDHVNWQLYRRAWALCVLSALLVLATSFRPDRTPESPLPPTFSNEQAAQVITRAKNFDRTTQTRESFPDRRPGRPNSLKSALWMVDQFGAMGRWKADTVTATTLHPRTGQPVSLVNVEALLPGRTTDLVVIYAHRDNQGASPDGRAAGDALGTMTLLQLAKDLSATRDLRRSFLLVSTDGATLNGAGARALAERLARKHHRPRGWGQVVAVVGIDRIGRASGEAHVAFEPSGRHKPPLGLVQAARESLAAEDVGKSLPGIGSQLLRLAVPVTAHEHGQLVSRGLPAVTIAGADERPDSAGGAVSATAYGDGVRALQRLIGTLDSVDALQSAGKTYALADQRVYRGWALKILVASLLIPVWVTGVDMVVRHRRSWNIAAAIGSAARAAMAGVWSLCVLWILASIGVATGAADRPPMPATVDSLPVLGVLLWLVLSASGWIIARGPDWRRSSTGGPDRADLAVAVLGGSLLSALVLAANPYLVVLLAPLLHSWIVLSSRHAYGRFRSVLIWAAGLGGTLGALLVAASLTQSLPAAPAYLLALVQAHAIPVAVLLPVAALGGLAALALVAALGRVANPALPALRRLSSGSAQSRQIAREHVQAFAVRASERTAPRSRRGRSDRREMRVEQRRAVRRRVNSR